ncbi:restriction endonuclease subunit S [Alcanivorax jadensis]|uniref:restriction endonuclease subunit S n=1 Tax=Alcanivorax jadensis TaxID=64988 RepID=UPI00356AFEAE
MRVQLQEIAEKVDYGVTASAVDSAVGPKFLRITDIQDGRVDWNSVPWCDCSDRAVAASKLSAGDIVFARTGATTGKSYLIESCPDNAVFASYLIRLRLNNRADPSYISHFFQTQDYWSQVSKSSRGVAQPGVNASKLKSLEVPLPPLEEQKRIAKILDAADALRAKRRESLAQLDALLQSTFLDLFGDPVNNPRGWDVVKADELCSRITVGIVVKPASYYRDKGVPAIRSLNIKENRIDLNDLVFFSPEDNEGKLAKTRLKANDIVLVRSGKPGTAAVIPEELDGANSIDVLIATPNTEGVLPEYLSYYFNSSGGKQLALGEQRGQVQKHLNVKSLKSAPIPVPPLEIQKEFLRIVKSVSKQKLRMCAHSDSIDNLFMSIQKRAFSGEL